MSQTGINKYLPITLIYFFFNGFLLPHGLLYTTILTPLFVIWLLYHKKARPIWFFFPAIAPFVVIHLINGVNTNYYFRSFLLILSVFIFAVTFHHFLTVCKTLRTLYKNILLINVVFVAIALFALTVPTLAPRFWYSNEITSGVIGINRLKMLTYEPSYYSLLFAPIALYYYLKMIILKIPNPYLVLAFLTIPLLLSLSFGVLLGLVMSLAFTLLSGFKTFFPNKNLPLYFIIAGVVLLLSGIAFIQLFPDNVFVVRITNVLSGSDASFRGRTTDSFFLGWSIAEKKSIFWGAGLGQVKEIGFDIFRDFYNYDFTRDMIGIPNSMGDTLAIFGLAGVFIRLSIEIYFFFKTRVYTNYYRLSLFAFIFIYQFTGSFITNIAEYVIWILAFHKGIFEEFDKGAVLKKKLKRD